MCKWAKKLESRNKTNISVINSLLKFRKYCCRAGSVAKNYGIDDSFMYNNGVSNHL